MKLSDASLRSHIESIEESIMRFIVGCELGEFNLDVLANRQTKVRGSDEG